MKLEYGLLIWYLYDWPSLCNTSCPSQEIGMLLCLKDPLMLDPSLETVGGWGEWGPSRDLPAAAGPLSAAAATRRPHHLPASTTHCYFFTCLRV